MLGMSHASCGNAKPTPQIDYNRQFSAIANYMAQILAEARNHNQSATFDWEPLLAQMQLQLLALNNVRQTAETIGAVQLAAAERLNSTFLGMAQQITDFRSESVIAATAMLRAEVDQTAILQQIKTLLEPKVVVPLRRESAFYQASNAGGLISIAAGSFELQLTPIGCYFFTANGAPQEKGRTIFHGGHEGRVNHRWDLELPPNAIMRVDYDAVEGFQPPELANVSRLTLADLQVLEDTPEGVVDDSLLTNAIAAAQETINSEAST
jgi:hypothetical protein